jgi:hypothetical protein
MIANKILPALYILDLEGEAASLEFLLGQNFGVKRVTIGSYDFTNDMEAASAGQEAVDFMLENNKLDHDDYTESVDYNPEFFPSIPTIEPTEEQLTQEAIAEEYAESLVKEDNQFPVVVTRRFDPLGDYVAVRMQLEAANYKIKMRIAINPNVYMDEKGKMMEEEATRATSAHREIPPTPASLH